MKYCRYCAFCISGDCYYCTCLDKVLNRVDKATNCKDYTMSELGDVDTGKPYIPHIPRMKVGSSIEDTQQIRFVFDGKD